MAATVVQAGTGLKMISEAGVVTDLALPAGVTLRNDVKPRWTRSGNYLVLVNTPSQPLIIDSIGTVRLLTPKAPRLAPVIAGVAGGTLSGVYGGVRYTFVTVDSNFNVISESDYSPASNTVTLTSQFLGVSGLDLSGDAISLRRLYRPTGGGSTLFQWVDLNGNVVTTIQDDLSDAGLSLFGAPILGTPPHLTTIASWRGRLWGTGDIEQDQLRYTEAGVRYAWPADNLILMPPAGSDTFGVVGLAARRDALGVGRRNQLIQITGSGREDPNSGSVDFDAVTLSEACGMESQESLCIFRDTAYFLWQDGVYTWGSRGITCISDGTADGKGQVRGWFTTSSWFNRDQFPIAFAHIDTTRPMYRLFLCSAGSSVIDSWVEYDIDNKTWWGPHSTALFTPKSAFNRVDAADRTIAIVGGPAQVYQDRELRTDGAATSIAMTVIGKRHAMDDPDVDKYFGQLSLFGDIQAAGTLDIACAVGELNAVTTRTDSYSMTQNRQRLGRIGTGKHVQLTLFHDVVGINVEIFGYTIDPVNILGRR